MKNSGISRGAINPRYHAQIAAALGEKPAGAKPMIRQDRAGLNKTEAAFLEYLKERFPHVDVLSQGITLKLGNGTRYTPDFFVSTDATNEHALPVCQCQAWEVKGFMRDDANVKLKVAAAKFSWITFYLVRRQGKTGGWNIQRILP